MKAISISITFIGDYTGKKRHNSLISKKRGFEGRKRKTAYAITCSFKIYLIRSSESLVSL